MVVALCERETTGYERARERQQVHERERETTGYECEREAIGYEPCGRETAGYEPCERETTGYEPFDLGAGQGAASQP